MGRTACTEPQCLYKGVHYLWLKLKQEGRILSNVGANGSRRLLMQQHLKTYGVYAVQRNSMMAMNNECRKNDLGLFTNCLLTDAVN